MGAQAAGQVNAANLGIPIAMFVLGDASQVAPVMLFQLTLNTPLYLTVMDTLTGGRRPTAVSYTHLDVYKRQVHDHPRVTPYSMTVRWKFTWLRDAVGPR